MTTWTDFLQTNFASDEDRETLRRAMGLTLTGNGRGTAVLLHGPGMSGKTTLISLIRAMMPAHRSMRIERAPSPGENVDFSKVWMVAWELPDCVRERDYAWIKFASSNDPMTARPLFAKNYFTYYPNFAMWMTAQGVADRSRGDFSRRVTSIAMRVPKFPERYFFDRLVACADEIRAWAVEGLVSPPPRIELTLASAVVARDDLGALTRALADELDLRDRLIVAGQELAAGRPAAWAALMAELGHDDPLFAPSLAGSVLDFLATLTGDPDARAHAGELYAAYQAWCAGVGRPSISRREFGQRMNRVGYEYDLADDCYIGLALPAAGLTLATAQPGLAAEIGGAA